MITAVPAPPTTEPGEVKRYVFCRHYLDCLEMAISNAWESFSCLECESYALLDWGWEDWLEDAHACADLLAELAKTPFEEDSPGGATERYESSILDHELLKIHWLMPPEDVGKVLEISAKDVLLLCNCGDLDYLEIGKLVRIKTQSVVEFLVGKTR